MEQSSSHEVASTVSLAPMRAVERNSEAQQESKGTLGRRPCTRKALYVMPEDSLRARETLASPNPLSIFMRSDSNLYRAQVTGL